MGVIYKLKDEVVNFIISQRQKNPLFSCRQLAEAASQKFSLNLSKSSVHDVLKESGIITPRGRKPKDKFEIPQEKKKQIQANLSQVKLLPDLSFGVVASEAKQSFKEIVTASTPEVEMVEQELIPDMEISAEYEGAGEIFLKAALWDLGIFSQENIKATDWEYYLTYSKGVKVVLENDKNFFIELPLPLERCIREVADGLINNVKPFILYKVSDEGLFKACMEAQKGFNIENISIVGHNDHILLEFSNIMELNKLYMFEKRVFVESKENNYLERSKAIFFSQMTVNNDVIDNMLNLRGFDTISKEENIVTLIIDDSYENKIMLQQAVENLNGMFLRDEQDRLVKVRIKLP